MDQSSSLTALNGAKTYMIEVNPLSGDWVHVLHCETEWSAEDRGLLKEATEGVQGVAGIRFSRNNRDLFIDFSGEDDLSDEDVMILTQEIFQQYLSPNRAVVFSHPKGARV